MKKSNIFKIAALTAVFAVASMFAYAQNIGTNGIGAADGPSIKVIDNKGTVKYIQSNNGITTITSTTAGNETRTTFQLGGTLDTATYINTAGQIFGLMGLAWETGLPAANQSATTGYTLLVRDESNGQTKKLLLSDIVDAGTYVEVLSATVTANTYPITLNGVTLESYKTVYVFRNGAKLIAGVDYSITNGTNSIVTLNRAGTASADYAGGSSAWETYPLYENDRIEIQFIK